MKKVIYILFAFTILFTSFSCKDKKETESINVQTEKIEKKSESFFTVEIDAIVSFDDVFELYYKDYDAEKYTWKAMKTKKVLAKGTTQKIIFKLPEKFFPSSIRIDFGKNKEAEDMILKSIQMSYEDFKIIMNQQEIASFFVANNYMDYDKNTGVIQFNALNGKFDPYMDSRPVFKKKLELEAR